jgi:RNA polymerase sigma-70 factor (ECF subfamily)
MTGDAGRRQRFDALFAAHRVDMASYCGWRTASAPDAEDAVAEVFLVAWRRIDDVPAGDAARAWLYATARRITANQRRARRRHTALTDRLARQRPFDPPDTPGAEAAAVHAALARLAERDREVLLLVEWEGLRPAELATVLGCREVTARGRLHRARRRFREAFAAVPPTADDPVARRPPPTPRDLPHIVHLATGARMRKAQP